MKTRCPRLRVDGKLTSGVCVMRLCTDLAEINVAIQLPGFFAKDIPNLADFALKSRLHHELETSICNEYLSCGRRAHMMKVIKHRKGKISNSFEGGQLKDKHFRLCAHIQ